MVKTWIGEPGDCNGCNKPFTNAFSDVRTLYGSWGNFCDTCLPKYTEGKRKCYGTGLGQRYEKQADKWVKVAG
jgi:hypothetical protein